MTLSYYRTISMTLYLGKFQFENKTKKSFSAIDWANFDKLITQTQGVAAMAVMAVVVAVVGMAGMVVMAME